MCAALFSLVPPLVPTTQPEVVQMPVIDFSKLRQTNDNRFMVIKDIATACREKGCFQGFENGRCYSTPSHQLIWCDAISFAVRWHRDSCGTRISMPSDGNGDGIAPNQLVINHGIGKSVMKGALEAASEFFESPPESKAEFTSSDIRKPVRYDCSNEGIHKSRSFLKHYAHPLDEWMQFWPREPPSYKEKMGIYAVEIRRVALVLLDAIFQSLGLGQGYLGTKLEEGMQLLAVNFYPQSTQPGVTLGLAPHSDYGFITLLLPSCPGLEVMDHETKAWKSVLQPSETLHVHIGDHLEVLSNGRFRTLVHRAVLNSENRRFSIASIHSLAMNEKVRSAEEMVDEKNQRMYKGSSFKDFLDFLSSNGTNNKSYIESLRMRN